MGNSEKGQKGDFLGGADTKTKTKNDEKKRLWTGIDHFTRCDDLYVMNNQQLQICKYFDTMCDKVEEVTREVMRETHLGMLGKRKKIKKKKEGGEKDDWTVVRGEESDKCVVVEERADGSRKLVTRDIPVKKQIWS